MFAAASACSKTVIMDEFFPTGGVAVLLHIGPQLSCQLGSPYGTMRSL